MGTNRPKPGGKPSGAQKCAPTSPPTLAPGRAPARPSSSVVSFRLKDEDFAAYWTKVKASGMNSSEFFRDCVLKNRTQVVARPKASLEAKRVLHLINKAGNNINQLAHRANADHAAGKIDARVYADILYQLDRISRYLKFTLAHVD